MELLEIEFLTGPFERGPFECVKIGLFMCVFKKMHLLRDFLSTFFNTSALNKFLPIRNHHAGVIFTHFLLILF